MSRVLVVGSGGREHALAWKLSLSPKVTEVVVAPGNDAWPSSFTRWADWDLKPVSEKSFRALARRARDARVNLAVIGPDDPLASGIADAFVAEGIPCFGPSRAAARLEASKAFAKEIMLAAQVPTADAFVARNATEVAGILEKFGARSVVVKADGLALGKGVRVCSSREEALVAARELLSVSGSLVIEERLGGEELSWMAFCDGERCSLLEPARDHKRLGDGDRGPNTGGMGAFSPVPGVPEHWYERMRSEVFLPVLREMNKRGTPFRGLLYAGLMVDFSRDRFWVLEFNARFGDPEAQVLLPRMNEDLYDWCWNSAHGSLPEQPCVKFKPDSAVVVVGAAPGYPERPETGAVIAAEPVTGRPGVPEIFWAGVQIRGAEWVTAGGRVFGAVGTAVTLERARELAYERLRARSFPRMLFRTDIAKGAERE